MSRSPELSNILGKPSGRRDQLPWGWGCLDEKVGELHRLLKGRDGQSFPRKTCGGREEHFESGLPSTVAEV